MILDPEGINHALYQDSLAFLLVGQGYEVLLADLPGIGSLGPGYLKGDSFIGGISFNQWFASILAGKSHVGLRTEDLIRIIQFIKDNSSENTGISAIAIGPLVSELLHAAVFNRDIEKICLIRPLVSFENIVRTRFYEPMYIPFSITGTLGKYDLPDLMAAIAPRKLLCLNPKLANDFFASPTDLKDVWSFPLNVYFNYSIPSNFEIIHNQTTDEIRQELITWLRD
jgi:hypothetical protein